MAERIHFVFEDFSLAAELLDTPTARAVKEALPFSSTVNRWGEEIYFEIPVEAELEPEAREVVKRGSVGYWPPGRALAVFFGPTPVSQGDECRAASPVNVFGRVAGDLRPLSQVASGTKVEVKAIA